MNDYTYSVTVRCEDESRAERVLRDRLDPTVEYGFPYELWSAPVPVEALRKLLDYTYHDEEEHYEETGEPGHHIFTSIKLIADWVEEAVPDLWDDEAS